MHICASFEKVGQKLLEWLQKFSPRILPPVIIPCAPHCIKLIRGWETLQYNVLLYSTISITEVILKKPQFTLKGVLCNHPIIG